MVVGYAPLFLFGKYDGVSPVAAPSVRFLMRALFYSKESWRMLLDLNSQFTLWEKRDLSKKIFFFQF